MSPGSGLEPQVLPATYAPLPSNCSLWFSPQPLMLTLWCQQTPPHSTWGMELMVAPALAQSLVQPSNSLCDSSWSVQALELRPELFLLLLLLQLLLLGRAGAKAKHRLWEDGGKLWGRSQEGGECTGAGGQVPCGTGMGLQVACGVSGGRERWPEARRWGKG